MPNPQQLPSNTVPRMRKMTAAEMDRFTLARTHLLRRVPQVTDVAFMLRPVYVENYGTWAVDGSGRIFISFEGWAGSWTKEECAVVLLHEIWHVLRQHPRLINEFAMANPHLARHLGDACDCEINDDMREVRSFNQQGIGEVWGALPDKCVYPDTFRFFIDTPPLNMPDGWTYEQYARHMGDEWAKLIPPTPPQNGNQGDEGQGSGSDSQGSGSGAGSQDDDSSQAQSKGSESGDDSGSQDDGSQSDDSQDSGSQDSGSQDSGSQDSGSQDSGSGSQSNGPQSDGSSDSDDDGSDQPLPQGVSSPSSNSQGFDKPYVPKGGPEAGMPRPCGGVPESWSEAADAVVNPVPEATRDAVEAAVAQAIIEAADKGIGTVPSSWGEWAAKRMEPPVIHWTRKLKTATDGQVLAVSGRIKPSYAQLNRRDFPDKTFVYPGRRATDPSILIGVDESGSMHWRNELDMALAVVTALMRTRGVKQVRKVDVDTLIGEEETLRGRKRVNTVSRTGGGTDMRQFYAYIRELPKAKKPTNAILFTDGETPWPTEEDYEGMGKVRCLAGIICPKERYERLAEATPSWITTIHIPLGDED